MKAQDTTSIAYKTRQTTTTKGSITRDLRTAKPTTRANKNTKQSTNKIKKGPNNTWDLQTFRRAMRASVAKDVLGGWLEQE
jgi:hypothetical protein